MMAKNLNLTAAIMRACNASNARLHKFTAGSEATQGVEIVASYEEWKKFVAELVLDYAPNYLYLVDTTHWTPVSGGQYVYDIMVYVVDK